MQRYKAILIDLENCTGCRSCEAICSWFHEKGLISPRRARIGVVKWEHDGIDIPIMCMQCEDAPCVGSCPVGALKAEEMPEKDLRRIRLDEKACIGCRICIVACPFGAPSFDIPKRIAIKCDLCDGDPQCVKVCPKEALTVAYVDELATAKKMRARAPSKLKETLRLLWATRRQVPLGAPGA